MPHVTFVHGLANKPSAEDLHNVWRRAILDGGLDLAGDGVTTEMVYWADVLYDAPLVAAAHESSFATEAEGEIPLPAAYTPEEIAFVEAALDAPVDVEALAADAQGSMKAQVYRAALMAVLVDTPAEKAYLSALASALGLDTDEVAKIHASMGRPAP